MKIKWVKGNGDEIETNNLPATVAKCKELGWDSAELKPKKKRGRPARLPEIEE